MGNALKKAWEDYVSPLIKRPARVQVAVLCYKGNGSDKKVLLVTSRDTGRWILPKGWPIDGKDAPSAAMQEAWEEAGVSEGEVSRKAIGQFSYEKKMDTGGIEVCETSIFAVNVKKLEDSFPEAAERERKWVTPTEAANMVQEPELQAILEEL
ncbi:MULTISPECIES: NUDIX hydrolase [Halocynthiibacter]|uniref:NUDIX hydrolase n=1 Tax=Halocynthiibacter halioticoli TaxID=2986804 RepID=A0AAE3IZZ8_9RHOB|nr:MULTISPECIES: NUDIX hydrolase [Halocynthiibacter]MCV6825220.1 NUDIX hydrolase [Halocynthiibacter halioticoli]MCW4058221.1 NUDIX hydrolase [Halocynthiibacter sp. SDUM655004]